MLLINRSKFAYQNLHCIRFILTFIVKWKKTKLHIHASTLVEH